MATTAVLAPQTAAGDSSEFTVTTPVSVYVVTTSGVVTERVKISLLKKVGTSTYEPFKAQSGKNRKRVPVYVSQQEQTYFLSDPGTYIIRKPATTQLIGVSVDNQT